jgi:hypothetical protein
VLIGASVLLGLLCLKIKIYGWFNLIPWAASVLIIGYLSKTKKASLINGAVFGYFLFVSYIFFGYKGNTALGPYTTFIFFTAGFSLIGAIAGLIGSYMGFLLRNQSKPFTQ